MAWQAGTSEPLGTVGQGGGLGMAPWRGEAHLVPRCHGGGCCTHLRHYIRAY